MEDCFSYNLPKSFSAVLKKLRYPTFTNILSSTYREELENFDAPWNTSSGKKLIVSIKFYTAENPIRIFNPTFLTLERSSITSTLLHGNAETNSHLHAS